MSSNIRILMPGYSIMSDSSTKVMKACGSCCLVQSNKKNILFDTMGPWERQFLLNKLSELKIHHTDIDHVVCSHSHPDHIGNINLFLTKEPQIIGLSVFNKDSYFLDKFEPIGSELSSSGGGLETADNNKNERIIYDNIRIDSNIMVEPTPGHTMECVSMIVENCDTYGTVGLVGDLYEKEEDLKDESIWISAGSQNRDLQRIYRKYIYEKVDYILPGHGNIFKTSKD